MTQTNLFPGLSSQLRHFKGDVASSAGALFWIVEKKIAGAWFPLRRVQLTREDARAHARGQRIRGAEVRIVPYKACIDTQGRHNRQITSERLDA